MMGDQKEKDIEYCREIYKNTAQSCLDEAVTKHLWTTNRLNEKSDQFTERLFWFAGVSIGVLPFAIENFSLQNSSYLPLLILSIILLIASMLLGIIDHYLVESFYKEQNQKTIQRIQNWRPVCTKMQNKWLDPFEIITSLENAEAFDKGLNLNNRLRSPEWPVITQVILVLLGFTLEITYILIQIL